MSAYYADVKIRSLLSHSAFISPISRHRAPIKSISPQFRVLLTENISTHRTAAIRRGGSLGVLDIERFQSKSDSWSMPTLAAQRVIEISLDPARSTTFRLSF